MKQNTKDNMSRTCTEHFNRGSVNTETTLTIVMKIRFEVYKQRSDIFVWTVDIHLEHKTIGQFDRMVEIVTKTSEDSTKTYNSTEDVSL